MNYTLDRFPLPEDKPMLEAFDGLQRLATATTHLERLLTRLGQRAADNKQAKRAMLNVLRLAQRVEAGEPSRDLLGDLMGRLMEMVGKRLVKAIVRPILNFAARMTMNLVRIAARSVLRWVLVPIFEAAVAAVGALLAPEILIGLGVVAAVAGGIALYRKYVSRPEIETVDVTPSGAVVGTQPEPLEVTKPQGKVAEVIQAVTESAPVKAVQRAFETRKVYKAKEGAKFTGFGADVDQYIREASTMFPILPLDVLRGFVKMESGWTGKMSPTGAIGTGQFIAQTWNDLISKGGAALGMQPITGVYGEEKDAKGRPIKPHVKPNPKGNFRTEQDPRFDKRTNTLATALLASQNAKMLKAAGLPITGANLYMMHNIGPGILKVMKGGEASPATLKAMRQNGMTASMNARDFLDFQIANYERAYQVANQFTEVKGDQPMLSKSMTLEPPKVTDASSISPVAKAGLAGGRLPSELIKGVGKTVIGI